VTNVSLWIRLSSISWALSIGLQSNCIFLVFNFHPSPTFFSVLVSYVRGNCQAWMSSWSFLTLSSAIEKRAVALCAWNTFLMVWVPSLFAPGRPGPASCLLSFSMYLHLQICHFHSFIYHLIMISFMSLSLALTYLLISRPMCLLLPVGYYTRIHVGISCPHF
jgi:hypothetical protein